jgi:hypothetical protein
MRELVVRQPLVLVPRAYPLLAVAHQHVAVLLQQRVVEPVVEDLETIVLRHENVVDVVRLLLRLLLVLGAYRVEAGDFVARAETPSSATA